MKTSCSSLPQNLSIPVLVNRIREDVLSSSDMHLFVSPSAYDTAWLAMIRDPNQPHDSPLFGECLAWVLSNQRAEGFWGEVDGYGRPTIDTLPATLVCMVALTTWNVGHRNIEKGVAFFHANAEKLLRKKSNRFPRWFLLVFPAMVEHAQICGLEDLFPNGLGTLLASIFQQRQHILETESLVDRYQYPPLLSYLETLPVTYDIEQDDIVSHLSRDGSLFQSPSATACAFMVTRHPKCLGYLQSLVRKRSNGAVPPMYPVDEGLIKLCVVNHLQRLGIAEHFTEEIEELLEGTYSHYISQEPSETNIQPAQIYKDSLAFRLLRMHGYKISPKKFCWFLHHDDIMQHMEKNWEYFSGVMLNVYGATQIMFLGEHELDQAKSFSRKLLEKIVSLNNTENDLIVITNSIDLIKHELTLPWITRLDHADHRMWIEQNEMPCLWMGKASFYRVSCLHHNDLMQLAVENYEFRQSIYRSELEKLIRWSKDHSLSDIGFGREKTAYCYFAVAACGVLPPTSDIRVIIAKSAVIITVADDYFDSNKGSLGELINLTEAIRRWEGKGLSGPSKIIFDALDELVNDMANINLQGCDITKDLRYIWTETFDSWLMEASWSRSQYVPSMDEYLVTGMTSIAVHTIVLPAWCILNSSLPNHKLIKPPKYEAATELLMMITRLLNDIQSYQKEQEDGKFNSILLYLKENPEADIGDSITRVTEILNKKTKEFLEHVLMDGLTNLPSSCRHLHLSCLKVFQMFFNSSNRFDSDTALLSDIQKAMYIPIQVPASQPTKHLLRRHHGMSDENSTVKTGFKCNFRRRHGISLVRNSAPPAVARHGSAGKVLVPHKFKFCFI